MASTTNKRMSFVAVCAYDDKSQFHFFSPEFWIEGWADLERVGKATVEEQWAEISPYPPPKIIRYEPGSLVHFLQGFAK